MKQIVALKIRDLNDSLLKTKKHLFIKSRIFGEIDDKTLIMFFIRYIYIVESLKIKMFVNNNILSFENIVFNVEKKFVTIDNCQNLIVKFNVTNNEFSIKRVVRFNFVIKIFAKSIVFISFKLRDKKTNYLRIVILYLYRIVLID